MVRIVRSFSDNLFIITPSKILREWIFLKSAFFQYCKLCRAAASLFHDELATIE